jgi:hypothetical protein
MTIEVSHADNTQCPIPLACTGGTVPHSSSYALESTSYIWLPPGFHQRPGNCSEKRLAGKKAIQQHQGDACLRGLQLTAVTQYFPRRHSHDRRHDLAHCTPAHRLPGKITNSIGDDARDKDMGLDAPVSRGWRPGSAQCRIFFQTSCKSL